MGRLRYLRVASSVASSSYSHVVADGDYAFVAGHLAADSKDSRVSLGDIEAETRASMELLGHCLREVGLGWSDVVRVGVFMKDLSQFARMNKVYESFFEPGELPARTTVGVASLLFGCLVEIDCVARLRPARVTKRGPRAMARRSARARRRR